MIPYGVRDGRAIHITSIPHTQKGLSCGCVCPACGASLVARLGDSRRHHFVHRSLSPNCTAKKAAESGLHLMAKQLIHDNPGIALPGLQITDQRQGFREVLAETVVVEPQRQRMSFDQVNLERGYEGFRPDVVTLEGRRELFIEIAVTHLVEDDKRDRLAVHGTACIEFQFEHLSRMAAPAEILEALREPGNAQWIYHPGLATAREALNHRLEDRLARDREEEQRILACRQLAIDHQQRQLADRNRKALQHLQRVTTRVIEHLCNHRLLTLPPQPAKHLPARYRYSLDHGERGIAGGPLGHVLLTKIASGTGEKHRLRVQFECTPEDPLDRANVGKTRLIDRLPAIAVDLTLLMNMPEAQITDKHIANHLHDCRHLRWVNPPGGARSRGDADGRFNQQSASPQQTHLQVRQRLEMQAASRKVRGTPADRWRPLGMKVIDAIGLWLSNPWRATRWQRWIETDFLWDFAFEDHPDAVRFLLCTVIASEVRKRGTRLGALALRPRQLIDSIRTLPLHPLAAEMLELTRSDELPARYQRHDGPRTESELVTRFVGHFLKTLWYDRMILGGDDKTDLGSEREVMVVPGPFY